MFNHFESETSNHKHKAPASVTSDTGTTLAPPLLGQSS